LNVLVTGAAGLYGSHLVEALVEHPAVAKVIGVDNFSRPFLVKRPLSEALMENSKLTVFRRSYQEITADDIDTWRINAVIHLAASVSIDESIERAQAYFLNNEYGTFGLAQTLLQSKSRPLIIYASSPEVYGNPRYTPIDEEHPLYPRSIYAVTKLAAEKHVNALHEWFHYPMIIIRNFNTYGENQNSEGHSAVIPRFVMNAIRGEPLILHNTGRQTRDFLYISDAVQAYLRLLFQGETYSGQVFNIGTGKQTSIADLATTIKAVTATSSAIIQAQGRPGDLDALEADISKIKTAVGWSPAFSLTEGLERTIAWYRRHAQ